MTALLAYPSKDVAVLTIARPDKRNALNWDTIEALSTAASDISLNDEVRCVVLKGEGSVFSAGADVNELASLGVTDAYNFINHLRGAIDAVFDIPVPVIGQIQGACVGGAMELAAACDLRVVAQNATFCMPEVLVGIPSVIQAALLPRIMGYTRASWLVLSGEVLDAHKAAQWGFVDRITAPNQLESDVASACAQVISAAPGAVRTQKQLLREWLNKSLDDAVHDSMTTFAASYETDEPKEFLQKHHRDRK